jgi:hypothetical protein
MRVQSNDPNDLYRYHFNVSQQRQQDRLGSDAIFGGSWSQPPWSGWHPMIGAGSDNFFQKYAQDSDVGFHYALGSGQPLGMNPHPPNHLENESNEALNSNDINPITVPNNSPVMSNIQLETNFTPEPQQRATFVPPFSQTQMQGLGKAVKDEDNVLFDEPFEIPEYKRSLHKKKLLGKK